MRIDNRTVNGQITIDPEDIIMTKEASGDRIVLPMPAYTVDSVTTKCSIDIGELIAGVILDIALPSGTITVKESK